MGKRIFIFCSFLFISFSQIKCQDSPPLPKTHSHITISDILKEREPLAEKHSQMKDFYSKFKCPEGPWIDHYGWDALTMKKRSRILQTFQKSLQNCEGYERPGIRNYVKRHMVYEDPEWLKPKCKEYSPAARNTDFQCLEKEVSSENKNFIDVNYGCYRNFKCWPQMQISHEGKVILRPTYKAGSYSMRQILKCTFGDMEMIWPCEKKRYTLTPEMESYLVLHMVRDPIQRFSSALIEQLTRWQTPGKYEEKKLKATKWFRLSRENATIQDITDAYVRDTECNINHPWWPHAATAMWHMTEYEYPDTLFDGTGRLSPIDYIFKTENLTEQWDAMVKEKTGKKKSCKMVDWNRHDDKFHLAINKESIIEHLLSHPALLRRMCAIYFSDYICFDYELPPPCAHMAKPKRDDCPLDAPRE